MKKRWTLRLSGIVLVLTLVTTSLVAGTYAKYVKEVTGSDQVRVAKFAFNLTDGANTLDQTDTSEATFDIFNMAADTGVYNNGVNGDQFIAPGTSGTFSISVENLSEVDVSATFVLSETNANSVPVYYTYNGGTQRYSSVLTGSYTDSGAPAGTYQDLAALSTAMAAVGATIEATDGTTATTADYDLDWHWAFETAGTQQTNVSDTALGVSAVPPTVKLQVACTVTQLD